MSENTDQRDGFEDGAHVDAWYRRTTGADTSRPSAASREAIRQYAHQAAHDYAVRRRWLKNRRGVFYGSLVAAVLAGLVIVPLWHSHEPRVATILVPSLIVPQTAQVPVITQRAVPPARRAASPPPTAAPLLESPAAPSANARQRAESGAETDSARLRAPLAAGNKSAQGEPPLLRAVAEGDTAEMTALLDDGADIDARDSQGRTALIRSILGGRAELVKLLLGRGADPKQPDNAGKRPIDYAHGAGRVDLADALRAAGAE